jgi:hypothetical protein
MTSRSDLQPGQRLQLDTHGAISTFALPMKRVGGNFANFRASMDAHYGNFANFGRGCR